MKIKLLSYVIGLACFPLFANADEQNPLEIVITPTRTAQTVNDTLASVTVIDRATLEQSQATTLTEVLRGVAGVQTASSGGIGQPTSVFMRGMESDHVLVLIDGVKVGSATAGTFAFNQIPVSQIERIEIVRGTRSSLYGSEAMGGVIQIFTRRTAGNDKDKNAVHTAIDVGVGSHQTYQVNGAASQQTETSRYSIAAEHLRSDGFNACDPANGGMGGCFTDEPDEDGYKHTAFSLNFSHQFSKTFNIQAFALRSFGTTDYDGLPFNNQVDFVQQVLGLNGHWQISPAWSFNASFGESRDENDNFGGDYGGSRYDTRRLNGSLLSTYQFSAQHSMTLGYDYLRDKVDSSLTFDESKRDNHGVFAQYQGNYQAFDAQASVRYDDNQQFGDKITGNVTLGYTFAINNRDDLRTFIGYGTAFKAPSFNELYYPDFGNPDLNPEEAKSLELGLGSANQYSQWTFNLFRTTTDQLIATAYDAASGNFAPVNINEAEILGAELTFNWQRKGWEFNSQLTALDAKDSKTDKKLPRRAAFSYKLMLAHQLKQDKLITEVVGQSHRFDDVANTRRLGGYTLLNLRSERQINKNWKASVSIDNVFNRDYEEVRYYETAGRTFFIRLGFEN